MADNGEKKPSGFGGFFEGLEIKDKELRCDIIETKKKNQTAEKCKKKGDNQGDRLRKQLPHRPGIRRYLPSPMNVVLMWCRWKVKAWTSGISLSK